MQRRAARSMLWSWMLAMAVAGCGGGGSPGSPAPTPPAPTGTPTIQVLPASYDFGAVTTNNAPAPLEVTIKNSGTAALRVGSIGLRAPANASFVLQLNGGSRPCGSSAPTIAASGTCTFQVAFQPAANGSYSASIDIASDDRASPLFAVGLSGVSEPVASPLGVRINQLDTCPGNEVNAYVSVSDQGGYPLANLLSTNFTITQNSTALPIVSSSYVEAAYRDIAIAAVMDHSGSLTDQTVAFNDMLAGFSSLFAGMRMNDVGEIVKFDSEVEVVLPFTSDKAALVAGVSAPFDKGRYTRLYDAAYQAVEDAAVKTAYRRAVIVTTDGTDEGPTPGVQYSTRSLSDVITNAVAKKVPIFTIGIGTSINTAVLQQMAADTGGLYYQAATSQNLATIYQQLTSILYEKQYTIKFDQLPLAGGTLSNLKIDVNSGGATGSATTSITSCN